MAGLKIIIDSREQKPLHFTCETSRECLPVGDYRAIFGDGTLSTVVFERKSIGDLYGTLSQGYERFKKEIEKSKENKVLLIIACEGSISKILRGTNYSKRTPISIVYQIFTIRIRHNIETIFCKDREEMSKYITHMFLALEREHEDKKIADRSATC